MYIIYIYTYIYIYTARYYVHKPYNNIHDNIWTSSSCFTYQRVFCQFRTDILHLQIAIWQFEIHTIRYVAHDIGASYPRLICDKNFEDQRSSYPPYFLYMNIATVFLKHSPFQYQFVYVRVISLCMYCQKPDGQFGGNPRAALFAVTHDRATVQNASTCAAARSQWG